MRTFLCGKCRSFYCFALKDQNIIFSFSKNTANINTDGFSHKPDIQLKTKLVLLWFLKVFFLPFLCFMDFLGLWLIFNFFYFLDLWAILDYCLLLLKVTHIAPIILYIPTDQSKEVGGSKIASPGKPLQVNRQYTQYFSVMSYQKSFKLDSTD